MTVTVHEGDCLDVLPTLPAASCHACVTDPPYHLASIVARFGADGAAPALSNGATGVYRRASRGFMGKRWDGGDVAFRADTWRAVGRVLVPGAHLVAFGAPKTYHRLACAIEDAGFEIRDCLAWLFGSGFPKNHDPARTFDKRLLDLDPHDDPDDWRASRSHFAAHWAGWGTALKPAFEPIVLARVPLAESTVDRNLAAHGAGALNIDACRVATDEEITTTRNVALGSSSGGIYGQAATPGRFEKHEAGRWPANVLHDGSDEVVRGFPDEAGGGYGARGASRKSGYGFGGNLETVGFGDAGNASRFFYCAKADAGDRLDSTHPTVKPVDLMRWLVRLIVPTGGVVLDPFAGTGTTAMAAMAEGRHAVMIEADAAYAADVRRRVAHVHGADLPLFAATDI